jgi:hypothetical protein
MTTEPDLCPYCCTELNFVFSNRFAPYAICSCGMVFCLLYDATKKKNILVEIGHKMDAAC